MKKLPLIALTLVSLLSLAACSDSTTGPETNADKASRALPPSNMTIAEIADAEGFTLLLAAVGYIAETNPSSLIVADILDVSQSTVFAPTDQAFLNLVRGTPGLFPPPVNSMAGLWSPAERAQVDRMTSVSAVGSPEIVRQALEAVVESTGADELILAGQVYDRGAATLHALRVKVGDDAFFEAARLWVERYNDGTATTADFREVYEEVSGQDLDEFFDIWLFNPQKPVNW